MEWKSWSRSTSKSFSTKRSQVHIPFFNAPIPYIYASNGLTGLKIIAIADPIHMSLDAPIRRIYELYSDYAMKNPFFMPDMPIRAELFDLSIQKLIKQINNVS